MTFRHARLPVLAFLLVSLARAGSAGMAPPQGESAPEEKVKAYTAALRDVLRIGGPATPVLQAQAKNESTATQALVNWIGQQIKEKAAPAGVDTAPAAIEPQAKHLVTASRELLGMRDKGLAAIAAASADPANEDLKPFLAKAEARVYIALCGSAIRQYTGTGQQSAGTFDGMFASLEKFDRDKVGDAFLEILSTSTQSAPTRDMAGEGLAQLGSKRHLDPLRALYKDPAQKAIQARVVYTLARLGDRSIADKQFADIQKQMDEIKKPEMTPLDTRRLAEGYRLSALLAQSIHDNELAIKHYESFLTTIAPIADKMGAQGAGVFQNAFYNLACLYSLKGDVETGFKYLEKAFGAGYANFKWANTDGDLTNLRKDPRFKQLVDKWESGKGAAESAPASKPS